MKNIKIVEYDSLTDFTRNEISSALKLLESTKDTFGKKSALISKIALPLTDRKAKKWLTKSNNPYLQEITTFADILQQKGVFTFNLSYEWGCTSGALRNSDNSINHLRVLDWPFKGLGENLFIVKQNARAGQYYNVTWPAVSGVYQAMAKGRFSAAINQAPMRRHNLTLAGDWLKNRAMVRKNNALPPSHLLRKAFEECKSYQEAKELLCQTQICIPVIYTLTGLNANEACVIERLESQHRVIEINDTKSVGTANHFATNLNDIGKGWLAREHDSSGRDKQFRCINNLDVNFADFNWLSSPIINQWTRVAFLSNAKTGQLSVQGYSGSKPVTQISNII